MTSKSNPLKYGGISAKMRAAMEAKDLTVSGIAKALNTHYGTVHNWLTAKNGIAASVRPRVAKLLGLDEADLAIIGPASAEDLAYQPIAPRGRPPMLTQDVLTYRIRDDDTVYIKVDMIVPLEQAMPLLTTLTNLIRQKKDKT